MRGRREQYATCQTLVASLGAHEHKSVWHGRDGRYGLVWYNGVIGHGRDGMAEGSLFYITETDKGHGINKY